MTMNTDHPTPRRAALALGRPTQSASAQERLTWYRERDRDPEDLHRRYVRAKYHLGQWSDADLARYHRYRRSLSRERAAQLVLARRYALRGLGAAAVAALVAGLLYAAFRWWKRHQAPAALPAPRANRKSAEEPA